MIDVEIDYFDQAARRYQTLKKTGRVTFVLDRNKTLHRANPRVERSLLILQTQQTLQDIVAVIRDKRNYQAIALLARQSAELTAYAAQHRDDELERDANILGQYADRLYDLDTAFFPAITIWRDLSLARNNFTEDFQ